MLESGYHSDLWFSLDGLFVDPEALSPHIDALADLVRPFRVSAVCGPLVGGAFVAQLLAARLGARFYYTAPAPVAPSSGLYAARYELPADLRRRVAGERVAVVDDAISAGSSVRATEAALRAVEATTVVVAALALLGDSAVQHFSAAGIPVVSVTQEPFSLVPPSECAQCRAGVPLENPAVAGS